MLVNKLEDLILVDLLKVVVVLFVISNDVMVFDWVNGCCMLDVD